MVENPSTYAKYTPTSYLLRFLEIIFDLKLIFGLSKIQLDLGEISSNPICLDRYAIHICKPPLDKKLWTVNISNEYLYE